MSPIDNLPPLREVVRRHDLSARKSLGQNFLFDLNLTGRIARAAGPLANVTVLEVGAGPGGLTRALLTAGAERVIAIERDERCLAALEEIARHYPDRLELVAGDALKLDMASLARAAPRQPTRIVANLPYNVGTALLIGWVESEPWPPWFDRLILMFQREVAQRIVAAPEQREAYGRLSVLCGWRTQARILFDVPAAAFTPAPKVSSCVVELIPRPEPPPCNPRLLSMVTQAAFGQRRKMLRQSLKGLASAGVEVDVAAVLTEAGIDPTSRAEQIDVAGFVRLTKIVAEHARAPKDGGAM